MPNQSIGGFRWVKNDTGGQCPSILIEPVASAFATAIFRGDAVIRVAAGTVEPMVAASTNIVGVCDGVEQYWDGENMRKGNYLPAATTYGTNLTRQSKLRVISANASVFETDTTAVLTEAVLQSAVGENCDIVATAGNTITGTSGHTIDIATRGALSKPMRIRGIANRPDQDFLATRVKILVSVNLSHLFVTAGV